MQKHLIYLAGFDIPQSTAFKIAFIAVTAAYIISMVVLFIFYRKAASKLASKKQKSIKNKQRKRRQH